MLLIPLYLTLIILFPFSSPLNNDGLALLALKSAVLSDPTNSLLSWSESDTTPCHWHGITCTNHRVTTLSLPNKNLTGYLPSELGLLDSLTRLSLSHNNFSNTLPLSLFNATNLRFLDLSHNSLTGLVPSQIEYLQNLFHLDLSSNFFNGSLPEGLTKLKSLTGTLNLSYNGFSGEIPAIYGHFPVMVSLDLRHNNLSGKVPLVGSLLNQGPTAFIGNPSLCGFPLQTPCPEAAHITSENPRDPLDSSVLNGGENKEKPSKGTATVVGLISGVSVVVAAVAISVWVVKQRSNKGRNGREDKKDTNINVVVSAADVENEGQNGKFVVLDEGFGLELEDLLRASAYVVGKGKSGIVYKVVVGGKGSGTVAPTVVAVRRLSEGNAIATWRLREFEAEMEAIGRINHPNIIGLKAYYYADDEKLLVTDFVRNGSLFTLLHGGSSSTLPPLSWATRLKIAQGTARGLTYIHEHSPRKYVHGNLKSSKIVLDDELHPYISGFGLTRFVSCNSKFSAPVSRKQHPDEAVVTSTAGCKMQAPFNFYMAPEACVSGSKFNQKCDVYSFGIILMELLTGRKAETGPENDGKGLENLVRKVFEEERLLSEIIDPALLCEVQAKKQVVAVFHIALKCSEQDPEVRPRMRTVSENLDRIKLL